MIQHYDRAAWENHTLELFGQPPCRFDGARLVIAPEIGPTAVELGWLRETLLSLPVRDVLDFGCGIGLFAGLFDGFDYTGLDRTETMIQAARQNHPDKRFLLGGIETIQTESFDCIFTRAVIQHNLEPVKSELIRHFQRVLRPNGFYLFHEHDFLGQHGSIAGLEDWMLVRGFEPVASQPPFCWLFQKTTKTIEGE